MTKSGPTLELHFTQTPSAELFRTVFRNPSLESPIVGIRGSYVPPRSIPFRWGPTLHALCIFFVKVAMIKTDEATLYPILQGQSSCPAASIRKLLMRGETHTALDLFGTDVSGRSLLHKMIGLVNPHLRRPGPLQVYLKSTSFTSEAIRIFIDDCEVTKNESRLKSLISSLEKTWVGGKVPVRPLAIASTKESHAISLQ